MEISKEVIEMIWTKQTGIFDHRDNDGGGKKCLDSGYIVKKKGLTVLGSWIGCRVVHGLRWFKV